MERFSQVIYDEEFIVMIKLLCKHLNEPHVDKLLYVIDEYRLSTSNGLITIEDISDDLHLSMETYVDVLLGIFQLFKQHNYPIEEKLLNRLYQLTEKPKQ